MNWNKKQQVLNKMYFSPRYYRLWNNKKFYFCCLILALISTVFCNKAFARSSGVISATVAEDYPPFYSKLPDGSFNGASYEIVRAVCANLGMSMDIQRVDTMQLLLDALESGQTDIAINLTTTPERAQLALFTRTPHIFESQDLIVRKDAAISYTGQTLQLGSYRLGVIYGWTYGNEFDGARYLKRVFFNDSLEQMKGLLSGQTDIAVNNRQFFSYLLTQWKIGNGFKVLSPSVTQLPVTIAVSKKYPDAQSLVKRLDDEINKYKATQQYNAILQKYGFNQDSLESD